MKKVIFKKTKVQNSNHQQHLKKTFILSPTLFEPFFHATLHVALIVVIVSNFDLSASGPDCVTPCMLFKNLILKPSIKCVTKFEMTIIFDN